MTDSSASLPSDGKVYRVLVVDDDEDILRIVRYSLEPSGYEVVTALSASEAFDRIAALGLPHLAVVDIRMPEVDGLDFCRQLHRFADLPVVMLTAVTERQTVIETIRDVAEDYITKPFDPKELAVRVDRVLRRVADFSYTLAPLTVIDERLSIDFARQCIIASGETIPLTPTETKVLHILVRSAGRTVPTDFLIRRTWPLEEVFEEALRVHIHRLRQKVEPDARQPVYVLTERGAGYSFRAPGSS